MFHAISHDLEYRATPKHPLVPEYEAAIEPTVFLKCLLVATVNRTQ